MVMASKLSCDTPSNVYRPSSTWGSVRGRHWRTLYKPETPILGSGITSQVLPPNPFQRSLVGCRLWGRTESDTTEATQQQQQQWEVRAFLVAHLVKNLPAMWETWVRFLGWEDPLEKGKQATPVFWPGEFHGLIVYGVAKSWTRPSNLHFHFSLSVRSKGWGW